MKKRIVLTLAVIAVGLSGCATTGECGSASPTYYAAPSYYRTTPLRSRGFPFGYGSRGYRGYRSPRGGHHGGHRR